MRNTPSDKSCAITPDNLDFRLLLESMPAAAYTCDADGLITYFNRRAVKVWGREPKLNDPVDRYCGSFQLLTSGGAPLRHDQCWMALCLQENKEYDGEEIVVERPDGSRLLVEAYATPFHDPHGNLVGAVNILVDIDGRKRDESLLAGQKRILEMIATGAPLAGVLTALSRFIEAQDGGLLCSILLRCENGKHIRRGAAPNIPERYMAALDGLSIEPPYAGPCGQVVHVGQTIVVKDFAADPRWSASWRELALSCGLRSCRSSPIFASDGEVLGAFALYRAQPGEPQPSDPLLMEIATHLAGIAIERRHDEDRLLALKDELVNRVADLEHLHERLREDDRRKDQFLAMLAHELRNPLAPVRNAVQILRLNPTDLEGVQWVREVIDRQMRQMTRLIDDLLDVSRISSDKLELRRERMELADVVREAVETSRPFIEQCGHELTVTLPREPIVVDADRTRLAQVLCNLLNNAAKYTDGSGRIVLRVERQGSEVRVSVQDNGIGIPAAKLPAVFEMFEQIAGSKSRAQGGLGLGLTLVKRLIEMHGGSVEARSDGPGQGSEFAVHLPIVGDQPHALPHGEDHDDATASCHLRVLIVDDNPDISSSLAVWLEMLGHHVRTAADGEEAVRTAATFHPHVVLLDIGLPKMNGYDAARHIRQESWGRNVILIAVTGWGQDDDKRRAEEAGFDRHLVKPLDPQTLMSLLAEVRTAT